MVLKIKEREEAIQLLAMDPQVCGKLLTHHRKGSKVDEEALRDRSPLRQSTGKGLQMGSRKNRGLRQWKGFFFCLSGILGIFGNLQHWNQVRRGYEGPTSLGSAPTPWARPPGLSPPRGSSGLLPKLRGSLLVQKKLIQSFFLVWTPFDNDFLKRQKQAENINWHWALG